MKTIKKFPIVAFFVSLLILNFGFTTLVFGQQYPKNFFPLGVGNKYFYLYTWSGFGGNGSRIETAGILADTVTNNKRYYKTSNFLFIDNKWIRFDSLTGILFSLDTANTCPFYNHEIIIDSIFARLNDSTKYCLNSESRPKCTDTSYLDVFGRTRQKKRFDVDCDHLPYSCSYHRIYLDSIGIYYYYLFSAGGGGYGACSWQLRGAIINGIVIGDTSTLIGINNFPYEIPSKCMLYQNYPNPFNPVTKITFDIPERSNVEMKIYNVLGELVAFPVNDVRTAGKYSVEFDGKNLPSGVYYYELKAGSFVETKKMVLVK